MKNEFRRCFTPAQSKVLNCFQLADRGPFTPLAAGVLTCVKLIPSTHRSQRQLSSGAKRASFPARLTRSCSCNKGCGGHHAVERWVAAAARGTPLCTRLQTSAHRSPEKGMWWLPNLKSSCGRQTQQLSWHQHLRLKQAATAARRHAVSRSGSSRLSPRKGLMVLATLSKRNEGAPLPALHRPPHVPKWSLHTSLSAHIYC